MEVDSMIGIIDNGKNANEIARFTKSLKIFKPSDIGNANAYILSDGNFNREYQKLNVDFIRNNSKPILGIGIGCIYLGAAFGAKIKQSKPVEKNIITIKQKSPILLDLKKTFSVIDMQSHIIEDLPDCFGIIGSSSKYEFEIIQHGANIMNPIEPKPFFGTHFNPELGLDGLKIINNFVKFVDVWSKYNR